MGYDQYSKLITNGPDGHPAYNEYKIYIDNICAINDDLCRIGQNGERYFAPDDANSESNGSTPRVGAGR